MMQRWHKTQNFCSKDTDEDKVWLSTPVANGALMASQMNRQHAKEWQEASSNVAGHSRHPFPHSISLCLSLSLFLQISSFSKLFVFQFSALFESICMAWLFLCFLLHHVACSASLCVSHSSLYPSLSLSAYYLHDEPLQNTSINYFLLDHPQSLCISAVARSTPPPFSFFSLSSPFSHLSRRFSLPLANCVNQFDQLTDSQRAPLWQTLIAPQQRQQQPRLGLWLQLIGTVALANLLSLSLTSPPPTSLSPSLSFSLSTSVFLFDSLWQSTFIWTLPFRVSVTNFAIHVEHCAQFSLSA